MLAASIISPQFIAGVIIVIVILCIIGSCIRIVPQAHAVIVERLGGYLTHGQSVFISRCHLLITLQETLS